MFGLLFTAVFSLAVNAHVCATNPADTQSFIDALQPGSCAVRQEVYVFNN